jgi:hypothetical protein
MPEKVVSTDPPELGRKLQIGVLDRLQDERDMLAADSAEGDDTMEPVIQDYPALDSERVHHGGPVPDERDYQVELSVVNQRYQAGSSLLRRPGLVERSTVPPGARTRWTRRWRSGSSRPAGATPTRAPAGSWMRPQGPAFDPVPSRSGVFRALKRAGLI